MLRTIARKSVIGAACLAMSAGCASTPFGDFFSRNPPSMAQSRYDKNKKKLNNPTKLSLEYAKWQEQVGNAPEARERYEIVLGENPRSVDAVLGLARLDQLAERTYEAEQQYLKAVKLAPDDPQVLDAVGQFYSSQERWSESIAHLESAMRTAPGDDAIRFHLAVALAKSGDVDGSLPHFVKAVGNAEAHYNVGLILYEQGRPELAEQQFLQAVITDPHLEPAQFWLDEVKREQENKALLASVPGIAPAVEVLPAPVSPNAATQPGARLAQTLVVEESYTAPVSSQMPAVGEGVLPAGHTSPLNRHVKPSVSSMQGTAPVIATPELPSNLTAQQFEQWQNQSQK